MAENGEFTGNIALVDQGCLLLGVVFAAVIDTLNLDAKRNGNWQIRDGDEATLSAFARSASLRMAFGRFHGHQDVDIFATWNNITEIEAIGSELKYGLLVARQVNVFPRLMGSSN